jgi:urease accessory protein
LPLFPSSDSPANNQMNPIDDEAEALAEIERLEATLKEARARLKSHHEIPKPTSPAIDTPRPQSDLALSTPHALLLLSDSALPLGSFAFSSGLESYLAHHKSQKPPPSFNAFLSLSLSSLAGLAIPYILAAYREPESVLRWDNDLDASTPCTVARRASVAQGRALLSVWERALRPTLTNQPCGGEGAARALATFSAALKSSAAGGKGDARGLGLCPNGHFSPLWALVCRTMGVSLSQTAYVFLFNHAKAVVSAAVRASVMGPYQAQGMLASGWLQREIRAVMEGNWDVSVEEAGQEVPVMDLWVGRHELLYSRIFNS